MNVRSFCSGRVPVRVLPGLICLFSLNFMLTGCLSRSLTGLTIQPSTGNTTVIPGVSAQFKAYGTYTESGHVAKVEDVTDLVTWSTTIPGVATVNASGVATGVNPGYTSIIATMQGAFQQLTATSNIVVNAPAGGSTGMRTLTGVSIVPGNQTLSVAGETAQFIAMGTYSSSPTSANLSTQATWQSSDPSVATVSSSGLVTAKGVGTATITALATGPDKSTLSGTAMVTVSSAQSARTLTALNVSPGSQVLTTGGQTAQFMAVGTYNGSPLTQDLTKSVTWQSSDSSIASITGSGVVTAMGIGTATITAVATGPDGTVVTGSGSVTVSSAATARILTSLTVTPSSQTLTATGETAQFLAIGTYSSAPLTANLTPSVQWQSSDAAIATVNPSGLVTVNGIGLATITALATASDGSIVSASATITGSSTPTLRTLTALTVTPGAQSLTTAQTAQFLAIGTYNTIPTSADLTSSVQWQSSDTAVATVGSSTGLVTTVGTGTATITAVATSPDGSQILQSATVTVTGTPSSRMLTGLTVVPATQTVNANGETTQFLAIGTYSSAPLTADLTNQVTWVSSDIEVATVNASGLATAVGPGETTITALATSGGNAMSASGVLQSLSSSGPVSLVTLTIYGVGYGAGKVVGTDTNAGANPINCSYTGPSNVDGSDSGAPPQPGAGCTGTFTPGTVVILSETPQSNPNNGKNSAFDGWSANCTPSDASGNPVGNQTPPSPYCTITVTNNTTVGAIFDPQ